MRELGIVVNWRSSLGLACPHFHEDVSVSVPFVRQCLTRLKQKKQKSLCNLRNRSTERSRRSLWLLLRLECYSNPLSKFPIIEFLTLLSCNHPAHSFYPD